VFCDDLICLSLKFSKISLLLNLPYDITTELTFEKLYQYSVMISSSSSTINSQKSARYSIYYIKSLLALTFAKLYQYSVMISSSSSTYINVGHIVLIGVCVCECMSGFGCECVGVGVGVSAWVCGCVGVCVCVCI